ncbi:MAG: hypothetical protein KUG73_00485, partial [Pseudomonadales bacterium]|nr:hypothetical protein [Pseudomonadales bacterium]
MKGKARISNVYKYGIYTVFLVSVIALVFVTVKSTNATGVLCTYGGNINNNTVGLSFIPDDNCYGYLFVKSDLISYHSYNNEKIGKLEMTMSDSHGGWLSGRRIRLKYDELATNSRIHFTNLRNHYKRNEELFVDYFGLTGYMQKDMSGAQILHVFNVEDAELPFYISCFYQSASSELIDVQCSVQFSYNSMVEVYLIVSYLDLANAKDKVGEIKSFIADLITPKPH